MEDNEDPNSSRSEVSPSDVVHRLNNSLMSILGNAERALGATDPSDPVHANLSAIVLAARDAAETCRGALAGVNQPGADPDTNGPSLAAASARARTTRFSGLILVVDDATMVRQLLVMTLEEAGFAVISAGNATEAMELFDKSEVAAMVLDVAMPDMAGPDLYALLSTRRSGVPVLFSSGFSADTVLGELLEDARVGFLQKPYTEDELLSELGRLLRSDE